MTDRDVVQRVGDLIERAVLTLRPREPHHKTPYVTTIKGTPAAHLMLAARPFFGIARQIQLDAAIASWRRNRKRQLHSAWAGTGVAPDPAACTAACEFSWLVGLLEGEGYFGVTSVVYPVLKLEMCDEDVVARACRILGAPGVRRDEPRDPRWSHTYVTAVSGHGAATWMVKLRGSMGERRRKVIDHALENYRPIRLIAPPTICTVPLCDEPHRSRGLCHKHYMSWSRDVAKGRTPRVRPLR